MSTDLSFNKEKMKVECGKLLRISNLGEKTLLGYIQNLEQSNGFSELEWKFLKETTNQLIPSSVYVCAEYEDKEAIVEWNKALIKATLYGTALPYVMTHTEEVHCHTKEDIFALYRKRYFFQNLYLFLADGLMKLKEYIGTLSLDHCAYDLDGKYFDNFYEYLFSFIPFDSSSGRGTDNCILHWLSDDFPLPDYMTEIYWWYLTNDAGDTLCKELVGWTLKGTSAMSVLKDDICRHIRLMLDN